MRSKTQRRSKALPPLVKVSFSARLARPWISGVGESMWVLKVAGTQLRGAGLLANEPYQLRYTRLGDVVLYATGRSDEKPEALSVERPKFDCDLSAMNNGDQEPWAVACRNGRAQGRQLLKLLESSKCKSAMARIETFRQKLLGCAICGARDCWWMTSDEEWARVPERFRKKVLCRKCFVVLTTASTKTETPKPERRKSKFDRVRRKG